MLFTVVVINSRDFNTRDIQKHAGHFGDCDCFSRRNVITTAKLKLPGDSEVM